MVTPADHDAIRKALEKRCATQGFGSPDDLATDTGIDRRGVHDVVNHMLHKGEVRRIRAGRYVIVPGAGGGPAGAGAGPVWSKTLPTFRKGHFRFTASDDMLLVVFDLEPLRVEEIDPRIGLLVLKSDPSRLVGFAAKPFETVFRRSGVGALLFRRDWPKVDEALSFTVAGIVYDMEEKRELATPAGRRRLEAVYENVRALSARLGDRELGYYDDRTRKELLRPAAP